MKDFNVIADGAAYIHRAEHLPEVGKDIDLGDGLQATVDEIRQPDLPNPVIRAWNVRPHDADQVFTAEVEALGLGYTLVIVGLPRGGLESHVAGASRQGGSARMLACGHSAGETAERGIEILRGIVKNGDPWPDVPTPRVWRAPAQDS
jgi:hypothetical protein